MSYTKDSNFKSKVSQKYSYSEATYELYYKFLFQIKSEAKIFRFQVKNKYAYVITQDIRNKYIEVIFFVGCMVSRPNRLFQD